MHGIVKWFDVFKRFGFIETEDPEFAAGIYVSEKHVNLLPGDTLRAGDRVEFTPGLDRFSRPRAENVQRVDKARGASPGRPGRYMREDMRAEDGGRGRHRAAAEAVFGPMRQVGVFRGD